MAPYYFAVDGVDGGEVTCEDGKKHLGAVGQDRCVGCFNEYVCSGGACVEGHEGDTCGVCASGWFWYVRERRGWGIRTASSSETTTTN